ncbi:MAG: protein kinase [Solobacterium sp.]|nr:protein kinase [Solobacterium sp.]
MSNNLIANRYEVFQHIGQGGMADVFLAVDTILNRQVAVKILRSELCSDAVSVLRFEREAQAATALSHPNIVEIYDVGEYKGHHYIVMEYVPGKSLKTMIQQRGALLTSEAIDIMLQLTGATAEAHRRGIIHRDIKPQNVIVKSDGSIKMLDFGIALAKGSMQLTQANNVMGSVHYLAPELARGQSASPQSDIYALGICLFEMLTGDVPFKAEQAVQVALMHMHNEMPEVRSINPDIPQSVENIVIRATAKDPAQRYDSCNEMLEDLRTCLTSSRRNEPKIKLVENTRLVRNSNQENRAKKNSGKMRRVDPELAATSSDLKRTAANLRKPARKPAPVQQTAAPVPEPIPEPEITEPSPVQEPEAPVVQQKTAVRKTEPKHREADIRTRDDGTRVVRPAVERQVKPNRLLRYMLIILVTLLVISAGIFALNVSGVLTPKSRTVIVPDLSGRTLTDAKSICAESGLVLDTSNIEYTLTTNTEKGQIISTRPAAGDEVDSGTGVSVTVSSGIGISIGDYVGENINAVLQELNEYKLLKVTTKEENDTSAVPGSIIRQELMEPGTMFNPNNVSEIVLVYAGYPTIVIPAEIDGMPLEEAVSMLESMGVEVFSSTLDTTGLSEEEIANLNTGVVIRSDPAAGSEYTQREDNYVVLYYY